MKERPIIFSAPMIRAMLEGRKTTTRRTVKPAKCRDSGCELAPCEIAGEVNGYNPDYRYSPYGKPGDRLWVRETFITGYELDDDELRVGDERVWYRADGEIDSWLDEDGYMGDPKWRSSIYMPRTLSRITLEVTAVRIERLQDISEEDALAEGIKPPITENGNALINISEKHSAASFLNAANIDVFAHGPRAKATFDRSNWVVAHYAALWESIHGADSWDANPWVWVIEFKRVTES